MKYVCMDTQGREVGQEKSRGREGEDGRRGGGKSTLRLSWDCREDKEKKVVLDRL